MKKLIDNKFANLYLNAANKLGLDYKIINEQISLIKIFKGDKKLSLSENVLSLNSQLSAILARNKKKTSILLQEKNIPSPIFSSFKNMTSALNYAHEKLNNNQPIVIKPLSGSLSIGITINPTTEVQVRDAIKEAFQENREIIIEEYIAGQHYRITVLDDQIIAVTQRMPAYIISDGEKSVRQLIKQKNISRANKNLPPIILRKKDHNYIKAQNINLSGTYPKGGKIKLQLGCDLDIGGERVKIDRETIPQINKDLFMKAAKTLNLRFAGIDYISPNITTPYTKVHSAINEINSAPHLDVHYLDSFPNDNYAAERLLEKYFQEDNFTESAQRISHSRNRFADISPQVLLKASKDSDIN